MTPAHAAVLILGAALLAVVAWLAATEKAHARIVDRSNEEHPHA